jgi:glycine cleavage system P protein (glycine dehydrogenase) subunit 2
MSAPTQSPGTRGLAFREPTLFEQSMPGRVGLDLPACDVDESEIGAGVAIPEHLLRDEVAGFPELTEPQVMRHFLRLSQWNFGVDSGFYPLGSCTMKYNPKVNEAVARLEGLVHLHPHQPSTTTQGALHLAYELQRMLGQIAGLDTVSLHPSAGAQGELVGLMVIRAHHTANGNPRRKVLIPDTAHGTNPASAVLCGYEVVQVPSGEDGVLHPETLREHLDGDVAALMLTNPNTLGLFETHIAELAAMLHEHGAQLYMDGANLNAMMGITRPGDQGVDVMHYNLHKTFATPHGGGGPGAGPVGVKPHLAPYLPNPLVTLTDHGYTLTTQDDRPESIGKVRSFLGNFGVLVRAYAYIRELGAPGLRRVSELAVLNANYMRARLTGHYPIPYDQPCMHEVVITTRGCGGDETSNVDVAKALIDRGFHPPTMSFPLVVPEALMIEPTETEAPETLDQFCDAMIEIRRQMDEDPASLTGAPRNTVVRRLDEVMAARKPVLRWRPDPE